MNFKNKEHKNSRFNSKAVTALLIGLGFLSAILAATALAASRNSGQNTNHVISQLNGPVTDTQALDGTFLAVVEKIDRDKKQITLFDVNMRTARVLKYNEGTNITDKYGNYISLNKITVGSMVDAACKQGKNVLADMNISKKAWEYANVNDLQMDDVQQIMKIASTKYKYYSDIFVYDGQKPVFPDVIAKQDVLTVWGYKQTIWSVIVNKGHGTVKLRDYKDYIGDFITIGYEAMKQITDNMSFTVREGTFNLTVDNGRYSAAKPVTVKRNEVTYVSLADLGSNGLKQGQVIFEITPYGANLSIDGKLTTYSDPVDLSYGQHTVEASLGGYSTYNGVIDVDSAGKTIKINLPESSSDKEATVTETNTDSGTGSDSSDTSSSSDSSDTGSSSDSSDSSSTSSSSDDTVDKNHKIYIKKPTSVSVYLDGKYKGKSPCHFKKYLGSHVLTFIKDGYSTTSYTVEVSNDGADAYFTFPNLKKKN